MPVIKQCVVCNLSFSVKPSDSHQKSCSRSCYTKLQGLLNNKKSARVCAVCGKNFYKQPSKLRKDGNTGIYCGFECYNNQRIQSLDEEKIKKLYVEEKLSIYEIGKIMGVHGASIQYRLKRMGIKRRTQSELKVEFNPTKGVGHSEATKEKLRQANKKQFSDPQARLNHGILTAKQIANGKTGKSGNKLETKFLSILDELKIIYIKQYRIGKFVYDFYLPNYNALIECDGTFWHSDPRFYPDRDKLTPIQLKNELNDKVKTELAKAKGFTLVRFWEHDVHNNVNEVIEKLQSLSKSDATR